MIKRNCFAYDWISKLQISFFNGMTCKVEQPIKIEKNQRVKVRVHYSLCGNDCWKVYKVMCSRKNNSDNRTPKLFVNCLRFVKEK